MIPVTPLEGSSVLMSVHSIERIETTPETVLVLAGGRRMVVTDVAQDLVNRITRVRARIMATAAATAGAGREPRSNYLRSVVNAADSSTPDSDTGVGGIDHASGSAASGEPVSTVNPLHSGQAILDRVLASIARCRWAGPIDRNSRCEQELANAYDGLANLARVLDHQHSNGLTRSIAVILHLCGEQLATLRDEHRDTVPPDEAETVLYTLYVNLTRLRKVWAGIAAEGRVLPSGQ